DVIAGGQHIDAGVEEVAHTLAVDAGAACSVLTVRNHQIESFTIDEARQDRPARPAARRADNVTEEQDPHETRLCISRSRAEQTRYLANSLALVSRITVTLICPG